MKADMMEYKDSKRMVFDWVVVKTGCLE